MEQATTMRQARARYLEEAGLGDGGYDAKWVKLKMGPVPFAIPNTASRKKAVGRHDLNHVLTAYKTDWPGEFEISAFELASGCRSYAAAWVLNLGGFLGGMSIWPRRTLAAFWRGCRSRNSYYFDDENDLLGRRVEDVRQTLPIAPADARTPRGMRDVLHFGAIAALALGHVLVPLAGFIALAVWAWN